ncbi:SDR family oxidoreductase [Dermatophilus congolensis]|uniref:Uncharacterized oxidoreductase yghA n=1 Tax=Dermatophilus congolensis TaxID=1863 RepID=A0AA46BLU0_9MICO|nr:SDR family oxidoreductase [Dermatophilus congolensis]MBO3142257.1 SDR family oxidoreductase [Dermatophilus congolensis]MBO3151248.1 SDR family oxidoreductase [Dermatophilus congolensis]MBO3161748.1 SDR family oxidoreductase [Dermatophilus congolensis]MBO3162534.1 SDR family oxidoreductase [Dermatophilus congolensis]MBO3176087.1 SDR family oxidoreductase [Dermatophilus congolensis]
MSDLYAIDKTARQLASPDGGFPAQEQQHPGHTKAMTPLPDHGEKTWVGHGRLTGLKALITGGDSGIGRAVAIAFAREGADIAINYLPSEEEDAQDVRTWVERENRTCTLLPGDIQDETTARRIVEDAAAQLNGLDIVVNNAGFQWARREEGLPSVTTGELDQVMKTNLYALFWICQQALPHLSHGASIINVSSIQAYDPSVSLIDYAATKAAINNFTANLAAELGPRGIRVNAVAPGPIWTPLQPATKGGDSMPTFGTDTPLGRGGQPVECAGAFVFLASPAEASYVTGTVIGVTGGKPIF